MIAKRSDIDKVAWEMTKAFLQNGGPNLEWLLNRLYSRPELLALVPDGTDKTKVHLKVHKMLKEMVADG